MKTLLPCGAGIVRNNRFNEAVVDYLAAGAAQDEAVAVLPAVPDGLRIVAASLPEADTG